jgi:hypothetical protein
MASHQCSTTAYENFSKNPEQIIVLKNGIRTILPDVSDWSAAYQLDNRINSWRISEIESDFRDPRLSQEGAVIQSERDSIWIPNITSPSCRSTRVKSSWLALRTIQNSIVEEAPQWSALPCWPSPRLGSLNRIQSNSRGMNQVDLCALRSIVESESLKALRVSCVGSEALLINESTFWFTFVFFWELYTTQNLEHHSFEGFRVIQDLPFCIGKHPFNNHVLLKMWHESNHIPRVSQASVLIIVSSAFSITMRSQFNLIFLREHGPWRHDLDILAPAKSEEN